MMFLLGTAMGSSTFVHGNSKDWTIGRFGDLVIWRFSDLAM